MSDRIAVFYDGELQQVASPTEIYEAPRNLFVARFIGESNTLNGTIVEADAAGCRVRLDDGHEIGAMPVGVAGGDRVTVVIRPERVRVAPGGAPANRAYGRIEEVVYFGDHVRVRLDVFGRTDFVVKITEPMAPGALAREAVLEIGWAGEHGRAFRG